MTRHSDRRWLGRSMLVAVFIAAQAMVVAPVAAGGPQHGHGDRCSNRNNNTIHKLLQCVTLDGVRAHQKAFQRIANRSDGMRASGTKGYDRSASYVYWKLKRAGYKVTRQTFEFNASLQLGPSTLQQTAPASVTYVEGVDYDNMDQSDPGDVTAAVTPVDVQLGPGNTTTSGCEATDFTGFPAGNIALLQRGFCTFEDKAENAAAAGAVGAIIFNQGNTPDREGLIGGTLGDTNESGIPVADATYARGAEWAGTAGLIMHLDLDLFRGLAKTKNIIAESRKGDPNNVVMVGAHLDSVDAGPGINDNGSGVAAVLETALQMKKVKPTNKVRFAFWGAEEAGLVGSDFYVNSLTPEQREKIALYLNFDMVGSPNHVFFIYDGDNSSPDPENPDDAGPGPAGSDVIEARFEKFFKNRKLPTKGTDFDGRSDYLAFIENGIPAGGLFTGAEGIKTAEEAALWGGTAGEAYDPCYHQACDTFKNVNRRALATNADAVAYATLFYAKSTKEIDEAAAAVTATRQAAGFGATDQGAAPTK
jgi:aminopeptidase Y